MFAAPTRMQRTSATRGLFDLQVSCSFFNRTTHAGSVAIGANAVADGASLGLSAFNAGGTIVGVTPVGEVSVGSDGQERRITNVAAGAKDTDAVNVSQLKGVNSKLDDLATTDRGIKYFHASSQASDSQALGNDSVAIGPEAIADGDESVAMGKGSRATGTRSGSLGVGNSVDGEGAFAIGHGNTVSAANAFVLGNNVSILDTNLAGAVVLGSGSTVAAAQGNAGGTINGVQYTYAGGSPQAGDVVSVGAVGAERQVQNVAAGRLSATSTDAVNGSQLYATNQALDALGSTVDGITSGGGVKYFRANGGASGVLADSQANGLGAVAAGPGASGIGAGAVAVGQDARAVQQGDVALGAGSVADRGAESYTGKYSGANNATAGTVSVGAAGRERTLSNVADGREATDGVNVRQLDGAVESAVQQSKDYTDQRINDVAGTVVDVGDRLNATDARVTKNEQNVNRLQQGADGMFQVNQNGEAVAAPSASGRNAVAGGSGAVASGQDSVAVGNGAQATGRRAAQHAATSVLPSVSASSGERSMMNAIQVLYIAAASVLLCSCTTMRSDVDSKGMTHAPVFPTLSPRSSVRSTWPSEDRLSKIHAGMEKAQIVDLIGPPHASAGLVNVHEWDYLFHLGEGDNLRRASLFSPVHSCGGH
ncbi:outer membrane protein assembly factor BamE [Stenotrophomonas sp. Sm3119]|uniref:outer membrane protein assembly factor BamE domain-containing protein n=1 Tax=Stenotrophomonas sp. Sm3119 TaxID=3002744 RepID=UPI0027E3F914|nr:outer membrane protein assembly factor BamE [Stenotrophomonas sp. Sm3119]MDQ7306475.1 outer membrane protein assembly factor BamE [Stenotrophomonas sp. Sm3119]